MLKEFLTGRIQKYAWRRSYEDRQRLIRRIVSFQTSPLRLILDLPCSILFGKDLKMLATIYLSDKWNSHWYAQHYEAHFRSIRRSRVSLLEIGIGGYDDPQSGGNSLRMWRTYFPNGRIYGIDLYDKSRYDSRRIKTLQGSQTDARFLDSVVAEIGSLSIVIDDGSHDNGDILFSFQHLFPHLADGGTYAIEDTQTSYWPKYGGNAVDRNDPRTVIGYFKSLADGLNWAEFPGDYKPSYLDLNIKSIAFYHNLIIVTKGPNRERGGEPYLFRQGSDGGM